MSDDELAAFLVKAAAIYFDRRSLPDSKEQLTAAIKDLDEPRLLSLQAISAIVGTKISTVRRIAGSDPARNRGSLNPAYLAYLGMLLANKTLVPEMYEELLAHGTSISTISALTNIPQATLYRWRKHG